VSDRKKDRYILPFDDIPAGRVKMPCIDIDEAVCSFAEVETGLSDELAHEEARRCLSCRRCLGCALCWAECDPQCIVFEQTNEPLEVTADTVIVAPGAIRKPARIASKFGYQESMNVVTGLQFERMLSEDGPYSGQILRPYDGDIPGSVGFVLAIEPGGKDAAYAYHALLYGLKEAVLAREKQKDLRVAFFVSAGFDFTGKFKELVEKHLPDAELIEGGIASVNEVPGKANVIIECGDVKQEMDLAVLLNGFDMPDYLRELDRRLGLKLESTGFWESAVPELAETAVSGVSLAGFRFAD
jgi:heterodisulfide reductase subunit A-like polyferredoxin